jgi:hypothetical protein
MENTLTHNNNNIANIELVVDICFVTVANIICGVSYFYLNLIRPAIFRILNNNYQDINTIERENVLD